MQSNVLLLQGPIGPFFSRFALDLTQRGFNVWKVNLNGGDQLFYKNDQTINYSGNLENWASYLDRLTVNKSIDRIYLYGDCRAYHRIARKIARRRGIRVFVFEEGYIRPNYITLEEHGVNGHSPMLNQALNYSDKTVASNEERPSGESVLPKKTFLKSASFSIAYYLACCFRGKQYPDYQHHRSLKVFPEGLRWIRSGIRKLRFQLTERDVLQKVVSEYKDHYFVCPLQVHCDMQVVVHSKYNSIEHFIGDVLISFARHAAPNKAIVFKHHPMDRAYKDYGLLFDSLVAELGLQGRVIYVHDVDLPTLLKHAEGTVLINSTVGMSSLFHGTPVKTMGKAIYDLPGLTAQRSLESFWKRPGSVNSSFFTAFRQHLVENNQINGSFMSRLSDLTSTGLTWSSALAEEHQFSPDSIELTNQSPLQLVGGLDVVPVADDAVEDDYKKAA